MTLNNSRLSIMAALLTASAMFLTGCAASDTTSSNSSSDDGPSGTLRWGLHLETTSPISPVATVASGDLFPQNLIFDSLFTLGTDDELLPMLATDWEQTSTSLKLTLRDDVEFSDGEVFDGNAVKANLEYLQANALPPVQATIASIESITVDSATEVTLNLSTPDPALPYELSRIAGEMVAPDHLETQTTNPVGSGPYIYDPDTSKIGSVYNMDANPNYWAEDEVGFEHINFQGFTNLTQAAQALKTGELDGANLQPVDASTFIGNDEYTIPENKSVYFGIVFLDREGDMVPALADSSVREAIAQGIDREALISVTEGGIGTPAVQRWETGVWNVAGMDHLLSYDETAATSALSAAGASSLTFDLPTNGLFSSRTQGLAASLGQVGVTANLTTVQDPFPVTYFDGSFAAAYTPVEVVHPQELIAAFISPTGIYNPNQLTDPVLQAAYDKALSETGDQADADWAAALEILYTQADVVFSAALQEPIVVSADISGASLEYLIPGAPTIRTMRFAN